MHKALAYFHEPVARVRGYAEAFAAGCGVHGVTCELRHSEEAELEQGVTTIWHFGHGLGRRGAPMLGGIPFRAYAGAAVRVGGDAGVWGRLTRKPIVRVSVEDRQLSASLLRRGRPAYRFDALGIDVQTVERRGEYVLVTGRSAADAGTVGEPYGEWERAICARLRAATGRPIVLREKPRNPAIDIPGVRHDSGRTCDDAIRGAWAVVCRSGNIGADAVLHGVPVWAESGPGAVFSTFTPETVEQAVPLDADARRAAVADIAAWNFTNDEIARGELWSHLLVEGLI